MTNWHFTFGYSHRHPDTGDSLDGCYVVIPDATSEGARAKMMERFGKKWSHQYAGPAEAGVVTYGLREIPLREGRAADDVIHKLEGKVEELDALVNECERVIAELRQEVARLRAGWAATALRLEREMIARATIQRSIGAPDVTPPR